VDLVLAAFAAPPLAVCPLVVGGVAATGSAAAQALEVLWAAPGLMIRQPLARARNILAFCDYHAVARPYRPLFAVPDPQHAGRGAAGRHIAKQAFCHALGLLLTELAGDPLAAWEPLAATAWAAFASDPLYAAQIAAAAPRAQAAA
jgi:hypothetical protein